MLKPLFTKLKHHLGVPEKSSMFFSHAIVLPSSRISWSKHRSQFDASPEFRPSPPTPPPVTLEVSLTLPSVLASEKALLHVASTI